jgi:hypothetical protein
VFCTKKYLHGSCTGRRSTDIVRKFSPPHRRLQQGGNTRLKLHLCARFQDELQGVARRHNLGPTSPSLARPRARCLPTIGNNMFAVVLYRAVAVLEPLPVSVPAGFYRVSQQPSTDTIRYLRLAGTWRLENSTVTAVAKQVSRRGRSTGRQGKILKVSKPRSECGITGNCCPRPIGRWRVV